MYELYTIGHSNHSIEKFIDLLLKNGVTAVCDVRSHPYSKLNPQYNRENIHKVLEPHHISYVFIGKELGPRSDDRSCFVNGKVQYHLLAKRALFRQGLDRLRKGLKSYRIALMCAEKDPLLCHRSILVCRYLRSPDIEIKHILDDGSIETNADLEKRLLRTLKIPQLQLFDSAEDIIERAYNIQSEKIAYSEPAGNGHDIKEGIQNS